jgi:hypothetical protein
LCGRNAGEEPPVPTGEHHDSKLPSLANVRDVTETTYLERSEVSRNRVRRD